MARLRNFWAWAAVCAASVGVSLSLLLGGALGTTAATGAAASAPNAAATAFPASASTIFGCRASAARVMLSTSTVEPAVANAGGTPCVDDSAGLQPTQLNASGSPLAALGTVTAGPGGAYTEETGDLDGGPDVGATAVANIDGVTLTIAGYKIVVAGPITSQAGYSCVLDASTGQYTDAQPFGTSSAGVISITNQAGVTTTDPIETGLNMVLPNLPPALSALISIGLNEQTLTPTSIVQRAIDIKLAGSNAEIVVGEAAASLTGAGCAGNVTPTPSPVPPITTPGTTTTITGANGTVTTVTQPGTTTTTPGTVNPPSGSVPSLLEECAPGSTYDPSSGDCVIVYDGQTIFVSLPFKGPVGGTVIPLGVAQSEYHSPCLTGAGPGYAFIVSASHQNAYGTALSDRILITGSYDRVSGLAGNDCIDGLGTTEQITDGNGADRDYATKGTNRIVAGNGHDLLSVIGGTNRIVGGNGPNTIRGGAGKNWITDGTGDDYIYGGSQSNRIDAYGNEKHIYGGKSKNRIWTNSIRAYVSCGSAKGNVLFARRKIAEYGEKHGCQKIGLLR